MTEPPNGRQTVKEILDDLRTDMKKVLAFMAVMEAANLPERVDNAESWQDRWSGRVIGLGVIGSAIVGLLIAHMAGLGI